VPTTRGALPRGSRWGALAAAALVTTLVTCLAAPAGAVGVLPPDNPPGNIPLSSSDYLASIDSARADEGVGPMNVDEAAVASLPVSEQVFIVLNEERIDRGLPPIPFMSAQLDARAQLGADSASDPAIPGTLSGGSPVTWGGSIWAGGLSSVFGADYYWMYSDGLGGPQDATSNEDCSAQDPSGCWGHRDIILHQFGSCGAGGPTLVMGAAFSATGSPGGSIAALVVGSCGEPPTDVTLTWQQVLSSVLAPPHVIGIATLPDGAGYWEAESDGTVAAFGAAAYYGSMAGVTLNSPIVGIAATADGGGYWLVAADGGVFTFGDAAFYGSAGSLRLVAPIVGLAATPDGGGYWLAAADGGVFTFGDASFRGSMGGRALNRPIVGMAADSATDGYWLVGADGGVFSFGAPFFGSTGSLPLARPIVGVESLSNGQGYRFEAADGGVFCFGQAEFAGSMGGRALAAPVVGMAGGGTVDAYWLVAADGGIFSFGQAQYYGRITS
jgi:hypothetical protein